MSYGKKCLSFVNVIIMDLPTIHTVDISQYQWFIVVIFLQMKSCEI